MSVNKDDLNKINNELRDIAEALCADKKVWMEEPVVGWVETKQLNLFKSREEYHVGEEPPVYNPRVC